MNFISKKSKIERKVILEDNIKIFGCSFIKKNTRIGFDCIIGYPTSTSIKKAKTSNILEIGDGAKIGKNCYIRPSTHIYESVEVGDNVQTGHRVFIRENTRIGNGCIIGTNSLIEGDTIIGDETILESNVYLPTKNRIGKRNFFGPNVCVTNDKRPLPFCIFNKNLRETHDKFLSGIVTEDYVCIGANTTILPKVKIGYASVVGAGAVVTKDVEPESIVVGVPAKPLSMSVYDLLLDHLEELLKRKITAKKDVENLSLPVPIKKEIIKVIK